MEWAAGLSQDSILFDSGFLGAEGTWYLLVPFPVAVGAVARIHWDIVGKLAGSQNAYLNWGGVVVDWGGDGVPLVGSANL